jgi:Tol biopolymer transport system component
VGGESVMGGKAGYYLVNLDTGKISALVEFSHDFIILQHEFAKDGKHFFHIIADRKLTISMIQDLDLQTGKERELYRSEEKLMGLAISPDGKWLVTTTSPLTLSLIPIGGGIPRTVHRFDQVNRISISGWTPDGKYILVAAGQPGEAEGTILYKVPVVGGEPQKIKFQQTFRNRPTVHPDGQRIAFGSTEGQSSDAEVWVMENFLPQ